MAKFDHITGNFLSLSGADLYYEEKGNKTGKTILLLHGGFGNLEDSQGKLLPIFLEMFALID